MSSAYDNSAWSSLSQVDLAHLACGRAGKVGDNSAFLGPLLACQPDSLELSSDLFERQRHVGRRSRREPRSRRVRSRRRVPDGCRSPFRTSPDRAESRPGHRNEKQTEKRESCSTCWPGGVIGPWERLDRVTVSRLVPLMRRSAGRQAAPALIRSLIAAAPSRSVKAAAYRCASVREISSRCQSDAAVTSHMVNPCAVDAR